MQVLNSSSIVVSVLILVFAVVGCSDDKGGIEGPPPVANESSLVTLTVGGQQYTLNTLYYSIRLAGVLSFAVFDQPVGTTKAIALAVNDEVGTFTFDDDVVGGDLLFNDEDYLSSNGSGSITITSLDDIRAIGSFSGTLTSEAGVEIVVTGTFNVPVGDP